MDDKLKMYPRSQRHFRGHRDYVHGEIVYHPNYIFGETNEKYYSVGITEEKKYDKKHNNHPLRKNPNNRRPYKESYVHKKTRKDFKSNYSGVYQNYNFDPEDKKEIDDRIDQKYK